MCSCHRPLLLVLLEPWVNPSRLGGVRLEPLLGDFPGSISFAGIELLEEGAFVIRPLRRERVPKRLGDGFRRGADGALAREDRLRIAELVEGRCATGASAQRLKFSQPPFE